MDETSTAQTDQNSSPMVGDDSAQGNSPAREKTAAAALGASTAGEPSDEVAGVPAIADSSGSRISLSDSEGARQVGNCPSQLPDDIAIRAVGVGKRYEMNRHRSMLLSDTAKMAFSRNYTKDYFWALRNVTFDVRKGESVALVGPNGAGKSTLLSLIARTAYPTLGSLAVNGRVSALLELGAGFHPHFTGRENIFINGIVMGLTRDQIEARMEEIIQFSELGKFIDEPIQNYSSGMLARLGFSVAASVDPEILIVDEALSVGDAAFQEKSFQRIMDFKARGCTILFVTHTLSSVVRFCDRAILLSHGQILESGPAQEICDSYEKRVAQNRLEAPIPPFETEKLPAWKRVTSLITILAMCGIVGAAGVHFVLRNADGMEAPNSVKRIQAMNQQQGAKSEKQGTAMVNFPSSASNQSGRTAPTAAPASESHGSDGEANQD